MRLWDATVHWYDLFDSSSAHKTQVRLEASELSALTARTRQRKREPTHGVPDVIAHSCTRADHRMFHPSHTYRPRLKRVERAKALMHEVMGRFS